MKTISVVSLGLASLLGIAATALAAEPAPKAEAPKADAAKAEAPKAPSAEAVAAGKKIDWATMDEKAKKKYMKTTVLPTMKKLFVAFDKKHYSAMNCFTCHGKDAEAKKFKMPSAALPKLPGPTDRAGFMALQEKKPAAAKFMGTEVKPTMAALLGKTEWSPTTPDGFGCYGCHTKEETAAAPPPAAGPPGGKPGAVAPPAPGKPAAAPAPGAAPGKGW